MLTTHTQLRVVDDLVSIYDKRGKRLLDRCYGSVQLSNGAYFSMHAMEKTIKEYDSEVVVEAGGNAVLPYMQWHAIQMKPNMVRVTLTITNTTPGPLPIERLDVLICREGYRNLKPSELSIRRTGWQTFSPAALKVPFESRDPWVQPPLHIPMLPPSTGDQWQLPWMTILQADSEKSLLIGYGGANHYLGTIDLRSSSKGHRITATNHVEGVELAPGETFTSEPLILTWGTSQQDLLDNYGDFIHDYMDARVPERIPTGWSHWLYYFANITQKDILENTRKIKERDLPFEYIQVDDGYETMLGDWLSVDKKKFPDGMKYVADEIRKTGRKPGIWIAPFMADARSEVFKNHPDWFLRDASGRHINVNRHGDPYWPAPNYGLDITHPEAYEWLKRALTTMCEEWGYEYIKTDYLYAGALRAKRYDPNCTSVEAYRRGMGLIRRVAGDRIVLGCGAPLLCSVGAVDDMRVGPDLSWEFDMPGTVRPVDHTLPKSREPLLSLFGHMWMNKKLWINDPDYIRVRQHDINLDWPQTVGLTALIAMGGGALYESDKLKTLEEDGYTLLNRLFPAADITTRPVGSIDGKPSKLLATSTKGDGQWYVAARFNWKDKPVSSVFVPGRWELPVGLYHIYDLLEERYLGMNAYAYLKDIPAKGVGLYSLCPVKDRPQVVATSAHLLGPAGDIADVTWRENCLTISLAGKKRPVKLYVHVPLNYRLKAYEGCKITRKDLMMIVIEPDRTDCTLAFKPLLSMKKADS